MYSYKSFNSYFKYLIRKIYSLLKFKYGAGEVIVFHAYLDNVKQISSEGNNSQCQPLPDSLVISPGKYLYNGLLYDMNEEGLYRFINIGHENQQRIVFKTNYLAIISGICWIVSYGYNDDRKKIDILNKKALQSKLSLSCDDLSKWAVYILSSCAIPSRVVRTLTLDDKNSYNNAHTMIEVYHAGLDHWLLFDMSLHSRFQYNGDYLNLVQFTELVKDRKEYNIEYMCGGATLDISHFKSYGKYDFALWSELVFLNKTLTREWYNRVAQVPTIKKEGKFMHYDKENCERIQKNFSTNYYYIEETEFKYVFYKNNSF